MARRPFLISANLIRSCPSLSTGNNPNGSNPKFPGKYVKLVASLDLNIAYLSIAADAPRQNPQNIGETEPKLLLRTAGTRSSEASIVGRFHASASLAFHNSDNGQPTAAYFLYK
jgi:hypothetical protein